MQEKRRNKEKSFLYVLLKISLISIVIIILIFLSFYVIELVNSFFLDFSKLEFILNLIIISISVLSIVIVLSLNEYKQKFIYKRVRASGRSYLSMEDIFQNKNRIKIIKEIIKKPGIHQNELMRACDLKKGQLQWHLDVLLINQIIKKETQGQYSIYYPNLKSFELPLEIKKGIIRDSSSYQILEIIKENPGINSSSIAKKTNLAKNTVKYHIDKLLDLNLIYSKIVGRRKELYVIDKKKIEIY